MTLPASGAISLFDVNDELGLTHTAAIGLLCTNVRTLFGTASGAVGLETGYSKSNTSVPGAPTGVSASATSSSAISVSFSAPGCTGHLTIDYYQVVCTGSGTNSATGSSPISVTGLSASTSYTFKVRAHNSKGYGCYSSSTGTATTLAVRGCIVFNSGQRCYSWTVPAGVTSISAFAVGAGVPGDAQYSYRYTCGCSGRCVYGIQSANGGGGGAAGYRNNYSVTPGQTLYVTSAAYGYTGLVKSCNSVWIVAAGEGGQQQFNVASPATYSKGGGGGYGTGSCANSSPPSNPTRGGGGGGAAGYKSTNSCSRTGGCGCNYPSGAGSGICGGGAAGGLVSSNPARGLPGGGVGIYGKGCSGTFSSGAVGAGGSGGGSGNNSTGKGGQYGGGGPGGGGYWGNPTYGAGCGGGPALRIVWPGCSRTFPNTDVGA